jgi:hypothetical protein
MSHDLWAGLSAVELAADCLQAPGNWFVTNPAWNYQPYALKDPSNNWPIADGAIEIEELPAGPSRFIAIEFKRVNEGVHGILTGLGQVQAYIKKGFSGSVLVLPRHYETLADSGEYASSVISSMSPALPIGVFTYEEPDFGNASPFANKLQCSRSIHLNPAHGSTPIPGFSIAGRNRTQWAHVREGSTVPDFFFRYLESVLDATTNSAVYAPVISSELVAAANRVSPGIDPVCYLSSTSASGRNPFADECWKRYWYRYVLTPSVQEIWDGPVAKGVSNSSPTALRQWDGSPSVFFARPGSARRSKPQLVEDVNSGLIDYDTAWDKFAGSINARAHSHREDIDSGLEAIGMLGADGRLTDVGFRYVTACKRAGDNANAPGPLSVLRSVILSEGGFSSLLHYIYALSDRLFSVDPTSFASMSCGTREIEFQSVPYRAWLADLLVNELRVANSSSLRGGRARPPLEAELILLRKLGLVKNWRIGVGIEISWPAVHSALELAAGLSG